MPLMHRSNNCLRYEWTYYTRQLEIPYRNISLLNDNDRLSKRRTNRQMKSSTKNALHVEFQYLTKHHRHVRRSVFLNKPSIIRSVIVKPKTIDLDAIRMNETFQESQLILVKCPCCKYCVEWSKRNID
ncbi:hypothetical protein SNEBB_005419 [Seison nebaliae]|nr:hypothetical protein SNEBB_005419 [Seison nebaliae]